MLASFATGCVRGGFGAGSRAGPFRDDVSISGDALADIVTGDRGDMVSWADSGDAGPGDMASVLDTMSSRDGSGSGGDGSTVTAAFDTCAKVFEVDLSTTQDLTIDTTHAVSNYSLGFACKEAEVVLRYVKLTASKLRAECFGGGRVTLVWGQQCPPTSGSLLTVSCDQGFQVQSFQTGSGYILACRASASAPAQLRLTPQ